MNMKNIITNKNILYFVLLPIACALCVVAVNFLTIWFANIQMFTNLVLIWLACNYLWFCIKTVLKFIENAIDASIDSLKEKQLLKD